MLALLGVVTAIALIISLLLLTKHLQDAREARIARQVAVTDAIHRELGAVVAPSVTRGLRGSYRLVIPVPLERPGLVAGTLAIAYRVLQRWDAEAAARVQIVLIPQPVVGSTPAARAV